MRSPCDPRPEGGLPAASASEVSARSENSRAACSPCGLYFGVQQRHRRAAGRRPRWTPAYPGACSPWVQVNAPAFGLPGTLAEGAPPQPLPFQSEEGFEVLVFKEQLYLGMEADNQLGARLWRTRSGVRLPWNQADWEEVSTAPGAFPFGVTDLAEADHIDSLAEFNGQLFVSTAARGDPPAGTRVFRSPSGDPGTWEDALAALGPGFGDPANENFKDMQVFEGWLCGGTWNAATGAQVWCTADGSALVAEEPARLWPGRQMSPRISRSGRAMSTTALYTLGCKTRAPGRMTPQMTWPACTARPACRGSPLGPGF